MGTRNPAVPAPFAERKRAENVDNAIICFTAAETIRNKIGNATSCCVSKKDPSAHDARQKLALVELAAVKFLIPGICRPIRAPALEVRLVTTFACGACKENYQKSAASYETPLSKMTITKGPQWCYQGHHMVKSLPETDERRITTDVVVLQVGPDLQEKINALDGNEQVRVLKICSEGFYESNTNPKLAIRLPNLEEFQTLDVSMGTIKLTKELTPKVKKSWMQNPNEEEEPDFTIECPALRDFSCYYWGPGDYGWLIRMLEVATKLERFDSYKLRVSYLKFASNHLHSIRLHRAELLQRIDLWAPRLTSLDVQAAYDLEQICFLKEHDLKSELPSTFCFGEELHVNAINACLGKEAVAALNAHPRIHRDIEMEDDDF